MTFPDRIYAALLRLYPREFRALYADEMRSAFSALHGRARLEEGWTGLLLLWLRTGWDTVRSALRERASHRGYRVGRSRRLRFPRPSLAGLAAEAGDDLRAALRALASAPGYTLAVVLTLALGIGANSAIFSVVYGVLLRPLPFPGAGELVHLRQTAERPGGTGPLDFSVHEIDDYRSRARTLAQVAEYHGMTFVLTGQGDPDVVQAGVVSHDFFDLLGVVPALGREFVAAEDRVGSAPVVVLGHEYWVRRFRRDPQVVGTKVVMNAMEHTVIGVLPPFPQFPEENDVYLPVSACPMRSDPAFIAARTHRMMSVYGRLAGGATVEEARHELHGIARGLLRDHPDAYGPRYDADAEPVREELVADARDPLLLLLAVAGFVLLIACANAANLALARTLGRERELAVRRALGAGRARVARQLFTESVLLALLAGGVGVLLALGGMDLLVGYAGRFTSRAAEIGIDRPVLLFTLLTSVLTGLAFGTAPAFFERRRPAESLGAGRQLTPGRRRLALQRALVAAQVAIAFPLLVGAGLMLRSVWALYDVETGIDTGEVFAFGVSLDAAVAPDPAALQNAYFDALVTLLRQTPGVIDAARTAETPLDGRQRLVHVFHPLAEAGGEAGGVAAQSDREGVPAQVRTVGPGYFRTLGTPILAGRALAASDDTLAAFAAVVNETFARAAFPGGGAVGRRLRQCWQAGCNPPMTVVGVVADVRQYGAEADPPPEVFRSSLQIPWGGSQVVVRAERAAEVLPVVGQVVRSLHPDAAVWELRTLERVRDDAIAPRRLTAVLLLLFAAIATGLTLAGIFGVLSFAAGARAQEMGIRRALGAPSWGVRGMVVREGLAPVVLGLLAGSGVAVVMGGAMAGLVWGVDPRDPLTFAIVAAAFLAVSALACWMPARRAAGVDVLQRSGAA